MKQAPTAVQHPPSKSTQRSRKSAKKKAKSSSQKELAGIRDHCIKLQEEGARDEEIEAWLFMANLMDSERSAIRDYLNSCKNNRIGKVSQSNVMDGKNEDASNKAFDETFNGFNSTSNVTGIGLSETIQFNDQHGSPTCNVSERNSDSAFRTVLEEHSSDSHLRELPSMDTEKQEDVTGRNRMSETAEAATKASGVSGEEAAWENPKPQRRGRPPRVPIESEPNKADVSGKDHGDATATLTDSDGDAEVKGRSARDASEESSATLSLERQTSSDGSSKTDSMSDSDMVVEEDTVLLTGAPSKDIQEEGAESAQSSDISTSETKPSKTVGVEADEAQPSEMIDVREKGVDPFSISEETGVPEPVSMTKENEVPREIEVPKSVDTTEETEVLKNVGTVEETDALKPNDVRGEAELPEPVDVEDKTGTSDTVDFEEMNIGMSKNCEGTENVVEVSNITAMQETDAVERRVRLVVYSSSEDDECQEKNPSASNMLLPSAVMLAKKSTPESNSPNVSISEHSRSSSLEKESAYRVSAENSESSCPATPRKRVRRKKHRTPAEPFFDDSIKVQLQSDSWKSFGPERHISGQNMDVSGGVEEAQASHANVAATTPDCASVSTQTEGRDFGAASKGAASPPQEDVYQFLVANNDYVCAASTSAVAPSKSKSRSQKLKLDKSTMVDITYEPSADWLYSCFPEVAVAHLNEVLEVCHGNVAVASELMFEWGISNPITPHDKHQLQKEMARHRSQVENSDPRTPESAVPESKNSSISGPPSLMDLCMSLVPKTNTDIQRQVISSSEQRLQRIESTESQRIRTISYEEIHAGADSGVDLPDHFSLASFTSSASSKTLHDSRWKPQPEVPSSESSQESFESSPMVDLPSALAEEEKTEQKNEGRRPKRASGISASSYRPVASLSDSALADYKAQVPQGDLALSLPAGLIGNLEQLFGDLPIANRGEFVF